MKAVVCDLDGTLIDTAPDIHAAANRMLESEGHAPLDMATIISFIGNGLPHLVSLVMGARGIDMGKHAELSQRTLDFYNAASSVLTKPFPGMIDALEALQGAGHRLGVCTNKPEGAAEKVLEDMGLARFFGVVIGGDSLTVKKPDPAPLHAAFEALGARARLYVGDSEVDAATAAAAAVPFALFTEGYRKVPVEELTWVATFDRFEALPGIAEGAFRKAAE